MVSAGPAFLYYGINLYLLQKDNKKNKVLKDKRENKSLFKDRINKKLLLVSIALVIAVINICVFIVILLNDKKEIDNSNNNDMVTETTDSNNNYFKLENYGNGVITYDEYVDIKSIENCKYSISEDVSQVKISAESSSGVGDVFKMPVAKEEYIIVNNKIGDKYFVNYKLTGDESKDECNQSWYNVTLEDSVEGFVWGGYKSMYVVEIR